MDDDVLTRFLGYIREAIARDERHSSFHVWKLLFIHKPGRDRYDLKGGCRPIVCLSHLLSNDERLVAALVTRHVDAVRTDVNNGYKPVTTLTQTVWYHRCQLEQADNFLVANVTYFGDMISFFDEISTELLDIIEAAINIPDAVRLRLRANTAEATFATYTPNGVVAGGTPKKKLARAKKRCVPARCGL